MTHCSPTSGHAPALPAKTHDLATVESRIAACCEWFALEPPTLTYDPDEPAEVLATREFLDWMIGSCASLDWLICGDVKGLVFGFRKDELQRRAFLDAMRNFDQAEQDMLVKAIRSSQVEHIPIEEALEGCRQEIEAYRAGLALTRSAESPDA